MLLPEDYRRARQREHLEALGAEIRAASTLQATVAEAQEGGPSVLRVVDPGSPELGQDVLCPLRDDDGEMWFSWQSWGSTIGPADDTEGVALAIVRVLTSRGSAHEQR
jgi:hypothetical protein